MITENDGFLHLLTPEQVEEANAALEAEVAGKMRRLESRIPEPANHDFALALSQTATLQFRARRFFVPPVPYPAGIRLTKIYAALKRLGGADENDADGIRALLEVMEEAVDLFWALVKPVTLWDRLLWRVRSNPFLHCTEQEIGELIGFFFVCRTRSRVRLPNRPISTPASYRTSRSSSRSSPPSAPRGSARTAIP